MSASNRRLRWALGIALGLHLVTALWLFSGVREAVQGDSARPKASNASNGGVPQVVQLAAPEGKAAPTSAAPATVAGEPPLSEEEQRRRLQLAARANTQAAATAPPPPTAVATTLAPAPLASTSTAASLGQAPLKPLPQARAEATASAEKLSPQQARRVASSGVQLGKPALKSLPKLTGVVTGSLQPLSKIAPLGGSGASPAKTLAAKPVGKAPLLPPASRKPVDPPAIFAAAKPIKPPADASPRKPAPAPLFVLKPAYSPPVPVARRVPLAPAPYQGVPLTSLSIAAAAPLRSPVAPLLFAPNPPPRAEAPLKLSFQLTGLPPPLPAAPIRQAAPAPLAQIAEAPSVAPAGGGLPITIYAAEAEPEPAEPPPVARDLPRSAQAEYFQTVTTLLKVTSDGLLDGTEDTTAVRLKLTVDRNGKLLRIAPANATPDWAMAAAAKVAQKAAPFPPMPNELPGKSIELSFPVTVKAQ